MEWAFVNDNITILLSTRVTLTGGSPLRVKYEKPDGTTGYWTATVCPTDATKAQVSTALDDAGTWRVQVYTELSGVKLHGLWAEIRAYNPLC